MLRPSQKFLRYDLLGAECYRRFFGYHNSMELSTLTGKRQQVKYFCGLRPKSAIQGPVLNGFRNVFRFNGLHAFEVSDRPGNLENPVVCSGC